MPFHLLLNTKQEMHFISFKRPRSANIRSWRVSDEEENIDNQKTQNKIHQKKMNKLKMILMRLFMWNNQKSLKSLFYYKLIFDAYGKLNVKKLEECNKNKYAALEWLHPGEKNLSGIWTINIFSSFVKVDIQNRHKFWTNSHS